MLHDEQLFCLLDKSKPFPSVNNWINLCKPSEDNPFHVVTKYKYLLHLEILPGNWLVAVERPPLEMTAHLPNALRKKKFGTWSGKYFTLVRGHGVFFQLFDQHFQLHALDKNAW